MPSLDASRDSMIYWLALVAQEAREKAGRLQVHVAAEISRDQSTIDRFEDGMTWPRNPDEVLRGYAADLDLDVRDLWAEAARRWLAAGPRAASGEQATQPERAAAAARRARRGS